MSKARELAELSRTVSDSADATAITIDSSEDVILTQDLRILDGKGARFGTDEDFTIYNDGSNTYLRNSTSNQDILFLGNDDGSANLQMLKLDASNAGAATFSGSVTAGSYIQANGNISTGGAGRVRAGASNELQLYFDGSHGHLANSTGNLTVDVVGSIILDADSGEIVLKDGGTEFGQFAKSGNDFRINQAIQDGDIVFRGNDGGSIITALTLDMSAAGAATFNNVITATGATFTNSSSGATPTGNTVLTVESNDNTELSILGGSSSVLALNFGHSGDNNEGLIYFNTTSGSENLQLQSSKDITYQVTSTNATAGHHKFLSHNTEIMRIDGQHNRVGIGQSSPNRNLHVSGGSADTSIGLTNTASGHNVADGFSITIENPTPAVAIRQRQNQPMKFYTNNTERARINSNGTIAVNSTATNRELTIAAITSSGQCDLALRAADDNNYCQLLFGDTSADNTGIVGYKNGDEYMFFQTGGAERMRISGGNVLVGTSDAVNTATNLHDGVTIYSDGRTDISRSGGQPINLRRRGGDGTLAAFYKEASGSIFNVGLIGTVSNDIYIGTGDTTLRFADGSDAILPTGTGSATRDGAIQLGHPDHRFSDLYLAGGAYLGGTAAANKLDDYEEGTWTPGVTGTGNSLGSGAAVGRYTKVGRMVYLQLFINNDGSNTFGSGAYDITGLPFTAVNSSAQVIPAMAMVRFVTPPSGAFQLNTYTPANQTKLQFYWSDSSNWEQLMGTHITSTSFAMYAGVVYEAA